jgi:hypothetical protein
VSLTVTVNPQLAVLPDASVAVQLTVVVPSGNAVPDAGIHTTFAIIQLSVAVALKLTAAEHWPDELPTVIGAGHITTGGCESVTVTVNVHALDVLPDASVAVQLTLVVPTGNVEPDAGVHIVVTVPGQLSVPVAENVTTAEH